jgi:hypothetical protein
MDQGWPNGVSGTQHLRRPSGGEMTQTLYAHMNKKKKTLTLRDMQMQVSVSDSEHLLK